LHGGGGDHPRFCDSNETSACKQGIRRVGIRFAMAPAATMFGLKQKLAFGFGGLLAILLIVSGLGIAVLWQYRTALDKFFYENWRSVEYGQAMVDSLERLNDIARPISGEQREPTAAELAAARQSAGDLRSIDHPLWQFESNCIAEDNNITLDGEREIAAELTRLWKGQSLTGAKVSADSYLDAYQRLLAPQTTGTARISAHAALLRLSPLLKAQAQAVIKLNLDNIKPIDGRAKHMADRATEMMVLLAVTGIVLAGIFTFFAGRSILRPLATVTKSIREIEQGNLDLVVQVKSHDELRHLAEAFNSMAAKLREFRRTDRAKLVRTQRTTQLAVNSLPDAIAIISPDGNIELSNETAHRLFQLDPGMAIAEASDPRLNALVREVASSDRPLERKGYESAIEVYDQGGQLKYFLPHAVPIRDTNQHLLGVTLVLADVTNLRRLDEMKSGLLSVVSHELKTPLTSIRMAVHLLLEEQVGTLNGKQTELLLAARDDSNRLERIIADLLDMGRLESGRVELDLRPEPAERLVSDAITPLETAFHDRGVTLEVDVPADVADVLVDPARIDHVFSNLLGNALKFTSPGGLVRVSAVNEDGAVRFVVEDTGMGIPAEYLPRIFDRFYRVPRENQVPGAGLGLAIAKEIVEAHGGHIAAQSRDGQGTRLSFTLQRADQSSAGQQPQESHETGIHSSH
jgi:NtrC-family two-component system sensor histidine kinase KinB